MFDILQSKMTAALRRLRSRGLLSEKDIDENLRSIRLALLEADVHYTVVKDFISSVREKAKETLKSRHLSPGDLVAKIVFEELVNILGARGEDLTLKGKPPVIMLVGLQGCGKTTTAVKIAYMLKGDGRKPYLISVDVYRPAAMAQLVKLAEKVGIDVHHGNTEIAPYRLIHEGLGEMASNGCDVAVIDTAGRLHIDEEMMAELAGLKEQLKPSEVLLVADGMAGQDAVNMGKSFDDKIGITGVILTKMEGDARGGAALSLFSVTGKPVKFVGIGERVEDLEAFHPERMASRILGMGDVLSLLDRVAKCIDQEDSKAVAEKAISGERINLDDFMVSLKQVRELGPIGQIAKLLPGFGTELASSNLPDERYIRHMEAIFLSMTPRERENPRIMNGSRRLRVARGSGTSVQEVNSILKQFKRMESFIKKMGFTGKGKRQFLKSFPFN
ncbi:MAG: signal recognition particle protein [Candidatus Glassbacteria bacterium]